MRFGDAGDAQLNFAEVFDADVGGGFGFGSCIRGARGRGRLVWLGRFGGLFRGRSGSFSRLHIFGGSQHHRIDLLRIDAGGQRAEAADLMTGGQQAIKAGKSIQRGLAGNDWQHCSGWAVPE